MKKTITLLLIGLFSLQAFADNKPIVQEGKGIAPTRQEAIKRAIFEAVAKAKGISVGSGEYEYSYDSAAADIENKGSGKEIGFDAVSIRTKGSTNEMQIGAFVKTYEVLEEKKDANSYEVKLKVWIYDYQPPDKNNRVRIAVMAPETSNSQYFFGNITMSGQELQRKIMHILNTKLTATNKFAVLDRSYIDKTMQEKGLVWRGDASLEEKAKLGNLLGADYLLTSTLNEAVLSVTEKYLESIGKNSREHEAKFKMDYSLIGAATSQIKFSDSVNLWLEYDRDVRKLIPNWQEDKIDYLVLADELIKLAVSPIVDNITQGLYPVRIAKILPNKTIAINKGGKDIAESDIYDVLQQGEELFDYDTKESLGKTEEPVATIKIVKVMPSYSYAILIGGNESKLSEGLICRKQGHEQQTPVGTQSDTKISPSGGVKMPYDK
jgi:Curli production assembly/transport component CsgG